MEGACEAELCHVSAGSGCSRSCCPSSRHPPPPPPHWGPQLSQGQVKEHLIPEASRYCQHMCFDLQPRSGWRSCPTPLAGICRSVLAWIGINKPGHGGCREKPPWGTPKHPQGPESKVTNPQNEWDFFSSFGNLVIFNSPA